MTPADGGPYAAAAAAVAAAAADNNYAATYNYINMTNRPPKILESPLDSKSLLSGISTDVRKRALTFREHLHLCLSYVTVQYHSTYVLTLFNLVRS